MKKAFIVLSCAVLALSCQKDKLSKQVFWMTNAKASALNEEGIEHVTIVWDTKNGQTSQRLSTASGYDSAPECGADNAVTFDISLGNYSGEYEFQIRSTDTVSIYVNVDAEGCFDHQIYATESLLQ